ncbi:MAG TPA: hypothetical protein VE954_21895 [Oligoflexus sp.]|uniref:hypothetical protein n=1 Tax=Oligoflexus sp. TaxID=1971216 RepID=UPI002D537C05|nr:hypothetical protein [Oligoflexus sp.]HYX35759.1 hypothetical protein [Oligoflexus sp.]
MFMNYRSYSKLASLPLWLLLMESCYANDYIDVEISGIKLADEKSYSKALKLLNMQTSKKTNSLEKICNQSLSEVARFSFFEGASYGQVMQIDVAKVDKSECKGDKVGSVKLERLTTNNGISLGQKYGVVVSKLRIKENLNSRVINVKVVHSKSKFLREKNMPEYVAKYIFSDDGTLTSFSFGFAYP